MASRVFADIRASINVRIDNVTEYLFMGTDQEAWGVDDFPNQAPPFELMWFETRQPSGIRSRNPSEVGRHYMRQKAGSFGLFNEHWGVLYKAVRREFDEPERRWETHMTLWRQQSLPKGIVTFGPIAERRQMIGEDGKPEGQGEIVIDISLVERHRQEAAKFDMDPERFAVNAISPWFFPVLLAISFMHCKNVKSEEVLPSRQLRRELQRKGRDITKYHVLDIMPMRKVLATEGNVSQVGLQRAFHICRGHFATYSEERPLFGKYAGRFWIPAHVRGSTEAGQVVKDYRVKAPNAA